MECVSVPDFSLNPVGNAQLKRKINEAAEQLEYKVPAIAVDGDAKLKRKINEAGDQFEDKDPAIAVDGDAKLKRKINEAGDQFEDKDPAIAVDGDAKLKRKINEADEQLEEEREREIAAARATVYNTKKKIKAFELMTPEEYWAFRGGVITMETAASMVAYYCESMKPVWERRGFMDDICPWFNVCHGMSGRRYPDKNALRAAKDANYLNLAKLAIAVYNKEKTMELEVEKVGEVKILSKFANICVVYDMTFTAKDVKAGGGCDPSDACKTFQAVVDINLIRKGEVKKVISCSPA